MKLMAIIMLAVLLWGCGKANDTAVTVDPAGKHAPGWITGHGASFLQNGSTCTACHGANLSGGISGVSCSSSSLNGTFCHAAGPHPIPWPTHNQVANQLNLCSSCHGAGLTGGPTAPACSKCHINLPAGTAPIAGTCISCHGNPPDSATFPNISGVHKAHISLGLTCGSCHAGGGTGGANHGTALTVAFPTFYNAVNGNAQFNPAGNCANVSCHGGQNSPPWRGGRIDALRECTPCHQAGTAPGQPQANSYYSGEHARHLINIGLVCTDCHDMSVVSGTASHFSGLQTPAFELSPAGTMRGPLNFNNGTISCSPGVSPPAGAFSIGVCHSLKNW